jgi:hypothetical protein
LDVDWNVLVDKSRSKRFKKKFNGKNTTRVRTAKKKRFSGLEETYFENSEFL